jgi:hypothetical protein
MTAKGYALYEQNDYAAAAAAANAVLRDDPRSLEAQWLKHASEDRTAPGVKLPASPWNSLSPAPDVPMNAVRNDDADLPIKLAVKTSLKTTDVPEIAPAGSKPDPGKTPPPLWPITVPLGVGLIGYGVSRGKETYSSTGGLHPDPDVPADNAARNWRLSAAVAGAAFVGLAAWEYGPGALSAAQAFFAAAAPSAPALTPALAGGGTAGGAIAANSVVLNAGINSAVVLGGAKAALEHYSFAAKMPPPQENSPSDERPNGTYEESPKHSSAPRSGPKGEISAGPANGQEALDRSVQIKETSPRRIGVDPHNNQIVILDQTQAGQFHGHVREWESLSDQMRNALIRSGLTDARGTILKP